MTQGQKTLWAFIQSHNADLLKKLIAKDYPKLEQSKVFDKAFQEPCKLPSLKIDNVITN